MKDVAGSAELQELVEDHLSRGKSDDISIAIVCYGLSRVGEALQRLQERSTNWGATLGLLRVGADAIRQGLPSLRQSGVPLDALLSLAERQLAFAELLQNEIVRLQAGETTLA
jgi:hypothetical protein